MKKTPRYYQAEALKAIDDWYADGNKKNPIIVAATGTGKALIIAEYMRLAIEYDPNVRAVCAIDTKELVQQNYNELLNQMPFAPAGIYSSGLRRKEKNAQLLFCGIQSVWDKASDIGKADILLIDECHGVSYSGERWSKFLDDMHVINPNMIIVGFTATPYRMDSGLLWTGEPRLFNGVAYEYSVKQGIADGYLSDIIPKRMATKYDVSGVGKRGGEYIESQLQKAVNHDDLTNAAIDEILEYSVERNSGLIFGAGVKHCESIQRIMIERGETCGIVLGTTPDAQRDKTIKAHKSGELKWIVNNAVLTKGYDNPAIDVIAVLRPTMSAVLWMQMVGRGFRIADGKKNCLLLDFAQNINNFGFIDEMVFKDKKPKDDDSLDVPPMKECEKCATMCHAALRFCPECGLEFPIDDTPKHETKSHDGAVLSTQRIIDEWIIDDVRWDVHSKPNKTPSLKVTYYSGHNRVSEWVCLEHTGFARTKAVKWWKDNTDGNKCKDVNHANNYLKGVPDTVGYAMQFERTMIKPAAIQVTKEGKYDRIMGRSFEVLQEVVQDQTQHYSHEQDDWDDLPF